MQFSQLPGETKIGLKLHNEITVLTEGIAVGSVQVIARLKKSRVPEDMKISR